MMDDISEDDSLGYYYSDSSELYEESLSDTWSNCVILSIYSIIPTIFQLIFVNFMFGLAVSTGLPSETILHIFSGLCGLYLLNTLELNSGKIIIIICFSFSYCLFNYHVSSFVIKLLRLRRKFISYTNFVKCFMIIALVLCEYLLITKEIWLQIRGAIMICSMKLISLADDIERGLVPPSIYQYFGYIFCSANILFGPWISFENYLGLYRKTPTKSIWWILGILRSLILSLFFLTISNCWSLYFITEDSNRWLNAYKEALSFRTSHYFICYLSEAAMIAAGFRSAKIWNEKQWYYTVCNPLVIEFPTALAIVVTNWNQPMHAFLKKYVYRSLLVHGKFIAILSTFILSSFLHGFELKVSVILISLGYFSYLQVAVRNLISSAFNCCLKIHPCKDCKHKYKRTHIACRIMLLVYSFFTVFHLAYLGTIMDPSVEDVGVYEKWRNLYFISHWIMLINILFIL